MNSMTTVLKKSTTWVLFLRKDKFIDLHSEKKELRIVWIWKVQNSLNASQDNVLSRIVFTEQTSLNANVFSRFLKVLEIKRLPCIKQNVLD